MANVISNPVDVGVFAEIDELIDRLDQLVFEITFDPRNAAICHADDGIGYAFSNRFDSLQGLLYTLLR
jgi:hypothetical protein